MVAGASDKDIGDIPGRALAVGVVMSRARDPGVGLGDVHFSRGMLETKESTRYDGDRILLVVDVIQSLRMLQGMAWATIPASCLLISLTRPHGTKHLPHQRHATAPCVGALWTCARNGSLSCQHA